MDELVEPLDTPDDADLGTVAKLADEQMAAEKEVAQLTAALKQAEVRLAAIRDDLLPQTMLTIGISEFKLAGGAKITVREKYRCGQLDDAPDKDDFARRTLEERLAALTWLEENGHGDIARRVVSITLGADNEALAKELIDLIKSHRSGNSLQIDHRRTVPWNTLSSFAKEQVKHQEDPPLELLGVTVQTSAKITQPKQETFHGRRFD
jgi:hypothetical protein